MDKFLIKKATVDDAYGIASVNAHTWYTTYQGLIPNKILEKRLQSIEERAQKIKEGILNKEYSHFVVKNKGNEGIIGMCTYGPSRNEEYPNSGEIYALYVLKEYQKFGVGKSLFLAGIQELLNLGYNNMIINVLEGNNAIGFYQKFGGIVIGEKYEPCGNIMIKENVLLFHDIKNIK